MVNIDIERLAAAVCELAASAPHKIVVSNRRNREDRTSDLNAARLAETSAGSDSDKTRIYEKIVITPRVIRGQQMYQAEQFTRTQAFHRNIPAEELTGYLEELLSSDFRQLDSFSDSCDMNIKISKKGKVLTGVHKKSAPADQNSDSRKSKDKSGNTASDATVALSKRLSDSEHAGAAGDSVCGTGSAPKSVPAPQLNQARTHDRKKKRLIEEGIVVEPLIDMGIFTKEGRIVKSMGDKFRQINRFLEIVDDAVDACGFKELTIVDFGCGKAYLTFILYYYLTYVKKISARMIGLDLKADVIADCNRAAKRYGYSDLHFEVGDISSYTADSAIDMVITLHACDTATDYALYNAVNWGSRVILSVPCCQHELNSQIQSEGLSILTKYGIIKERFAALATDALRASMLEHEGYKAQVLEFVDLSHTPKNLLIRAVKTNVSAKKKQKSLSEVEALISDFHADPTLYRLLTEKTNDYCQPE